MTDTPDEALGVPPLSVELAQICNRLGTKVTLEDVVRGFELVFGAPPDPSRPISDVADELAAALNVILSPSTSEEPHVRKSVTQVDAKGKPGMTAGELRDFLVELDDATVPSVRIWFGGGIKSIKAEEHKS